MSRRFTSARLPSNAELLFHDSFDVANNASFDSASIAGRLSGALAGDIKLASAVVQQTISGNQLSMKYNNSTAAKGRVRFQNQTGGAYYDWAAGTKAAAILAAGGLRIEFDWTPFTPTVNQQHVVLDFSFTSFADGSNVSVVASVGGTQVDSYTFTWDGNSDKLHFELETAINGELINNYSISTRRTSEETPIFADSFDADDTSNFDSSALAGGRLTGALNGDVRMMSSIKQQTINGNQLSMVVASIGPPTYKSGRVRFHSTALPGDWYDWIAGSAGADILSHRGFRVEFDWTVPDPHTGWISFSTGFGTAAEPDRRVLDGETDYGVILFCNGGAQRFDNGTSVNVTSFTETTDPQHVLIDYTFDSFADGQNVDVKVSVGGTQVDSYTFGLAANSGELYMELGTYQTGELINDFRVSVRPMGTVISIH